MATPQKLFNKTLALRLIYSLLLRTYTFYKRKFAFEVFYSTQSLFFCNAIASLRTPENDSFDTNLKKLRKKT